MDNDKEKLKKIIQYGTEITGSSGGAVVGFFLGGLIGGPGGAAGGAALGTLTQKILVDLANKVLSQREKVRVGAVAFFAIQKITERLENNDSLRNDSFFQSETGAQSNGEQLFEGVLLKARNEYQEKKIRYFGFFYANLAFAENIAPATANCLLKIMERLTYRQMVLLSLIKREGPIDMEALRRFKHRDPDLEALKREEMDLHSSDLGSLGLVLGNDAWRDTLSRLGDVLSDLADLNQIPDSDIDEIRNLLACCSGTENPIVMGPIT